MDEIADSVEKTIEKFIGRGKANYDHIIVGVADDERLRLVRVLSSSKDNFYKKIEATVLGITGKIITSSPSLSVSSTAARSSVGPSSTISGGGFYVDLLRKHKNLIFFGPPGTGKTYLVETEILPYYRTSSRTVVFHQSFTYDEFVEGLTPSVDASGNIKFEIKDGVFLDAIEESKKGVEYCLFIDEFNRGNVSSIFGEFLTLLEEKKRGGIEALLGMSKRLISVPENLHIVCTMNTADRSTHMLDAALRRRFTFFELKPDVFALESILKNNGCSSPIIGGVNITEFFLILNRRLSAFFGYDNQIGHAYYIDVFDESSLVDMLIYKLIPQIEDYADGDLSLAAQALDVDFSDPESLYVRTDVVVKDPVSLDVHTETRLEKNANFDAIKLVVNCHASASV